MNSLIDVARDQHLQMIEGYVLANNGLMLSLMTRLGFKIENDPDDATMRRVVKLLEA
jgi:acetyltransferase